MPRQLPQRPHFSDWLGLPHVTPVEFSLSDLLKTEKTELCEQNLKRSNAQSIVAQEKNFSTTSSDFEGESQRKVLTVTPGKRVSVPMAGPYRVCEPVVLTLWKLLWRLQSPRLAILFQVRHCVRRGWS